MRRFWVSLEFKVNPSKINPASWLKSKSSRFLSCPPTTSTPSVSPSPFPCAFEFSRFCSNKLMRREFIHLFLADFIIKFKFSMSTHSSYKQSHHFLLACLSNMAETRHHQVFTRKINKGGYHHWQTFGITLIPGSHWLVSFKVYELRLIVTHLDEYEHGTQCCWHSATTHNRWVITKLWMRREFMARDEAKNITTVEKLKQNLNTWTNFYLLMLTKR